MPKQNRPDAGAYLPSPKQIAADCAAIRAGWSPAEFVRRQHGETNSRSRSSKLTDEFLARIAYHIPTVQTPPPKFGTDPNAY